MAINEFMRHGLFVGCLVSLFQFNSAFAQPAFQSGDRNQSVTGGPIYAQSNRFQTRGDQDIAAFRLRPGTTVTLAEIPSSAVENDSPPFWLRLCRSNEGQGLSTNATYVLADNVELFSFSQLRCTFVAFKQSVSIRVGSSDTPEISTQFLGRY